METESAFSECFSMSVCEFDSTYLVRRLIQVSKCGFTTLYNFRYQVVKWKPLFTWLYAFLYCFILRFRRFDVDHSNSEIIWRKILDVFFRKIICVFCNINFFYDWFLSEYIKFLILPLKKYFSLNLF